MDRKYFKILHSDGKVGLYDTDNDEMEDMLRMAYSVVEITEGEYRKLERQVP